MNISKNSFKKYFLLLLLTTLMVVLAACGDDDSENGSATSEDESSGEETTLSLTHVGSTDHQYHLAAEIFKELIEERSNGEINIEIYSDGQLGGENESVEGVGLGTIDMTMVAADSAPANLMPEYNVFGIPYLFEGKEHAYNVLDGEIGQELLDMAEEQGMKGLGYWEIGLATISNSVREIHTPEDLDGISLRVQLAPIWEEFTRRFGALATPMEFTELYSSLEQGVVDGQENPISSIVGQAFYEVQPHIALTHHVYKAAPVFMNLDKWNSFSEEQQELIIQTVADTAERQRAEIDELEKEQLEYLRDEGITVTEPDLDPFREQVEGIEEEVSDLVPQELVDRIRNEAN